MLVMVIFFWWFLLGSGRVFWLKFIVRFLIRMDMFILLIV